VATSILGSSCRGKTGGVKLVSDAWPGLGMYVMPLPGVAVPLDKEPRLIALVGRFDTSKEAGGELTAQPSAHTVQSGALGIFSPTPRYVMANPIRILRS